MKTTSFTSRVDSRLAAYAALATAALAAPALPTADALPVIVPSNINIPSNTAGMYLNVVTGVSAITPAGAPGWDVNPFGSTTLSMFTSTGTGGNGTALGGLGAYVGTGTTYFNLTLGTIVNGSSTFGGTGTTNPAATTPLTLNSNMNFVGFRFFNETTGVVNYGYMQIALGTSVGAQPRTIVGYAYDNQGLGITVVPIAVPEPTTFALFGVMAVGALGVRAWRGRGRKAA